MRIKIQNDAIPYYYIFLLAHVSVYTYSSLYIRTKVRWCITRSADTCSIVNHTQHSSTVYIYTIYTRSGGTCKICICKYRVYIYHVWINALFLDVIWERERKREREREKDSLVYESARHIDFRSWMTVFTHPLYHTMKTLIIENLRSSTCPL